MSSLKFLFAGEAFLILFVLFFVVCFPLLIGGLVFTMLRRNKKNRAAWALIAGRIGFRMPNPKKLEMLGRFAECDLRLSVGARRRGGGEESHTEYFTFCESNFSTPLRFLLSIKTPRESGIFKSSQSNEVQIGNRNFDRKFTVGAYDPQIVRNLLLADFPSDKTQNLLGDLMLAAQNAGTVTITDEKVYLENSGQIGDEKVLREMIRLTAHLANRFQTARRKFPLADWEKQLFFNWKKIATENALVFDEEKILLQGVYKKFLVYAALNTSKGIWQTQLRLKFPQSLMTGLKIMPENSLHKAFTWLGAQDIETGISEFDEKFIVKGKNPSMAKRKLQPAVCMQLVGLNRKASAISVDDREISAAFDRVLGDERELRSCLEAFVSTAELLLRG